MTRLGISTAALLLAFSSPGSRPAPPQNETTTRTRVTAANPQDVALHQLLVKAKREADRNDYESAAADYEKYLAQKPNDAAAHFDLGYVYTAMQQTEKAVAEYRKAIAIDPKNSGAYLNLGISLLDKNPREAIAPLEKVTELEESYEKGHYLLGLAEERAGESAAAVKAYAIAERLDPNDASVHAALGRMDLSQGNAVAAEPEFHQALRLKPDYAEAQWGLARSLAAQNKNAEAVSELAEYLETKPNETRARLMRASLLVGLHKNDAALAELDRAEKDGPEPLEALQLRAVIYFRKSDFAQAATVLGKAAALAPNDADIRARLGHALLEEKQYEPAARELHEAFRLNPQDTDVLRDLIAATYESKNYPATLAALDVLGQREMPNAGAWFVRATCYDHMGQAKAALAAYQKFLAMNKDLNSNQYFEAAARARFLKRVIQDKR